MTISEEQRQARRKSIGASDIGKILGLSQWAGPKDCWAQKVYDSEPGKTSPAAYRGIVLEEGILQFARDYKGLVPPGFLLTDNILAERKTNKGTPIKCNTDAVVWSGKESAVTEWEIKTFYGGYEPIDLRKPRQISEIPVAVIEAKTAKSRDEWGEPMTDQVPLSYLVQVLAQMWASGAPCGYIPVLLGDLELKMYKVMWNPDLWTKVEKELDTFWKCVIDKRQPEGPAPSLYTVRDIVREFEKVTTMETAERRLVEEWQIAKAEKLAAIKRETEIKAQLLLDMEDGEVRVSDDGYLSYTEARNGARTLRWKLEPFERDD